MTKLGLVWVYELTGHTLCRNVDLYLCDELDLPFTFFTLKCVSLHIRARRVVHHKKVKGWCWCMLPIISLHSPQALRKWWMENGH